MVNLGALYWQILEAVRQDSREQRYLTHTARLLLPI